jgi:hypothetical protein
MDTTATKLIIPSDERREVNPYSWHEEEKAFRAFLDENMAGQDDIKDALVEILAAIRNPLRDPNTPIFSVLMVGPSTSGKTLGFKLLVQWVHGSRDRMLFFSGSDFEEKHQIQKLIGAPHGYIGFVDMHDPKYRPPQPGEHDDSALLSQHNLNNTIIDCKEDVVFILFDEWEKFHFAFNRFMLRPLREGTGELNNGRPVNFRNVVMGFTSNLGSDEIEKLATPMGFTQREKKVVTKDDVRQIVVRELCKGYPPEFRNRINKVLYFAGLSDKELVRVVDIELKTIEKRIIDRLGKNAFVVSVDDNAKLWLLAKDGTSDEKSPVPAMQQKMVAHLVNPLGRMVRLGLVHGGDKVEVTHKEGEDKLTFYITADPVAAILGTGTATEEPAEARVTDVTDKVGGGATNKGDSGADKGANNGGTDAKGPGTGAATPPETGALQLRTAIVVDQLVTVETTSVEEFVTLKTIVAQALTGSPYIRVLSDNSLYGTPVPVMGGVVQVFRFQAKVTAPIEVMMQLKRQLPMVQIIVLEQPIEL